MAPYTTLLFDGEFQKGPFCLDSKMSQLFLDSKIKSFSEK